MGEVRREYDMFDMTNLPCMQLDENAKKGMTTETFVEVRGGLYMLAASERNEQKALFAIARQESQVQ